MADSGCAHWRVVESLALSWKYGGIGVVFWFRVRRVVLSSGIGL